MLTRPLNNRQEASTIPNLLVAPRDYAIRYDQEYEADEMDGTGYYEDGAYYAPEPLSAAHGDSEVDVEHEMDPQLAYFNSILSRFEKLRAQLQRIPPPEAIARLGSTHPVVPPRSTKKRDSASKWWREQMQRQTPVPAQIASMHKANALRALGALASGGKLLRSGQDIEPSVTLWVWALLARLPDRGELSSEEIGVVRELSKRAVLVAVGLRENNEWQEGMQEVEAGLDEEIEDNDENEDDDEAETAANDEEIQLDIDDFDAENETNTESIYHGLSSKEDNAPQIGPQMPISQIMGQPKDDGEKQSALGSLPSNRNQPVSAVGEQAPQSPDQPQIGSEEAEFNAAKARILASLEDRGMEHEVSIEGNVVEQAENKPKDIEPTRSNTRATVDMILTVAGELYGQRDLLEFRLSWDN